MLKTKFFLTLFALNGLLLSVNSASAATLANAETAQNIINLSETIANLVDVSDRSLLETAINRALLAQNNSKPNPAGGAPVTQTNSGQSIINGTVIADPNRQPIVNGKVANPDYKPNPVREASPAGNRPLTNGIKIRGREPIRQNVDKPFINGTSAKPEN